MTANLRAFYERRKTKSTTKTQYVLKLHLDCSIWINKLWKTVLPLISCMTLGKLMYCADFQFSHLCKVQIGWMKTKGLVASSIVERRLIISRSSCMQQQRPNTAKNKINKMKERKKEKERKRPKAENQEPNRSSSET